MLIPEDLVASIVERRAIVLVGAGLSRPCGLPSWTTMLTQMIDWASSHSISVSDRSALLKCIKSGDLLIAAEDLRDQLGKESFRRFMAETFRKPTLRPSSVHHTLANVPFSATLTTNYDTLLEAAYTQKLGALPHTFTHQDVAELSATLRTREPYILKMHGTVDRIDTIVFGSSDYRDVIHRNAAYKQHLITALSNKTLLFLGFSLTDPDLLLFLDQLRSTFNDYTGNHYALMSSKHVLPFKERAFKRDYGIQVLTYTPSADDHPEVEEFLKALAERVQSQMHTSSAESLPPPPFEDLAGEVRLWLQAIRYTLDEPRPIDRRTVEMTAHLEEGTLQQRVLVRCVGGEISLTDVTALRSALNLRTNQGWLISDTRISPSAQEAITSDDTIQLFTLSEFLRDLIWSPYIDTVTDLVEQNRIPELYVDPSCYKQRSENSDGSDEREEYGSLDAYIDRWLTERGKMHISLLGEFGSGKTWFCRHYVYRQLQRYLKHPVRERLPLLITLRAFNKSLTAQQLVNDALLEQYKLPFIGSAFDVYEEMNRRGKILLVLDGFDEMARQVNYQTVVDNFWELAKLVSENSKVILTSRTEYFRRAKESETVFGGRELGRRTKVIEPPEFEVLYINPLTSDQIRDIIVKRLGPVNGLPTADRILSMANLADLARKPVLIELLLAALEEVSANVLQNPADVYLYATNRLLLRNITAEKTFTTTRDKLLFLCELAWDMISSGEIRIHYTQIPDRIRSIFGEQVRDQHELDHWDYDLRNQTLLHRTAAGLYEFAHKSLAEYFVALKFGLELGTLSQPFLETYREADGSICATIYEQKNALELRSTFSSQPLTSAPMEAVRRLLDAMLPSNSLESLLRLVAETEGAQFEDVRFVGGNAITLLVDHGWTPDKTDFSRMVLAGGDFGESDLRNCQFAGADLRSAVLSGCQFGQETLLGAKLQQTEVGIVFVSRLDRDTTKRTRSIGRRRPSAEQRLKTPERAASENHDRDMVNNVFNDLMRRLPPSMQGWRIIGASYTFDEETVIGLLSVLVDNLSDWEQVRSDVLKHGIMEDLAVFAEEVETIQKRLLDLGSAQRLIQYRQRLWRVGRRNLSSKDSLHDIRE